MTQIILTPLESVPLLTGLVIIGIVVIVVLLTRRGREAAVGICATALDQTVRKNANKEKALAFIREKGNANNEEIREHLGVSRALWCAIWIRWSARAKLDKSATSAAPSPPAQNNTPTNLRMLVCLCNIDIWEKSKRQNRWSGI